ncbi:MAG: membrane protease subunit [Candidatus Pacebacteria bacterium]|nr:membrane protease subunit [Candidatus Paceibacterota bacterium]
MHNTKNLSMFGIGAVVIFILVLLWAIPQYKVWTQELNGKALFKEAEWSRQIAVEEARAKKESAILEAEAEVERAKGVAEANDIVAGSLEGNEEYLRYLWINGLQTNEMQVIYVPTEAGLPILEAGRR